MLICLQISNIMIYMLRRGKIAPEQHSTLPLGLMPDFYATPDPIHRHIVQTLFFIVLKLLQITGLAAAGDDNLSLGIAPLTLLHFGMRQIMISACSR